MTYPSFNDRLIATGGRPAGFDYLRIILATAVIFFHSFDLTTGYNVAFHDFHGIFRPIDAAILPMFFALSGFLVAGSLERSQTLISFLGLRVIRLIPALLVETVISAMVIGILFTKIPYTEYFSNKIFFQYFLNIIGDIHFFLPGVFEANPIPRLVNAQLWTIPWELKCYLAISAISIIGFARKKSLFLMTVILVNLALMIHHYFFGNNITDHSIDDASVGGVRLVLSFLYGILFYLFRREIKWNKWIFLTLLIVTLVITSRPLAFWGDSISPMIIAYLTIYLGLLEPRKWKIVSSGDYSYGIYLYGFPIQQALVESLGPTGRHWYINFPCAFAIAAVMAYFSWHVIEKHASGLRPWLFKGEKSILARYTAMRTSFFGQRKNAGSDVAAHLDRES